ncbi:MAG: hypothetical protein QNJ70_15050 [Xenococcaceae cyanobacterium MO_207.B15]|nr:hypothetical protein [Xenococcaceae cyanobacterium MO_207.B15]
MKIPLKVEQVVCTTTGILIIFHTPAHCWQFCCIDQRGIMHKSYDIFYSLEKAEIQARSWLARLDYY